MESVSTSIGVVGTVVGLFSAFQAQRDRGTNATLAEYLEWLRRHDHQSLIDLIEQNIELSTAMTKLLAMQHDEVVFRLKTLEELMTQLVSASPGFDGIAAALHPNHRLSDQAFDILRQFHESGASELCHFGGGLKDPYGTMRFAHGGSGELAISEKRFLQDDLDRLVSLGLLSLDYSPKGNPSYRYTREAHRLVSTKVLEPSAEPPPPKE